MFDIFSKEFPKVPAPVAQYVLRIPLALLFFQQGMSKFPLQEAMATAFGLPLFAWGFAAVAEIGSAIGLLLAGLVGIVWRTGQWATIADNVTRFCGITMACIATGVIWTLNPQSLSSVLLNDYLHVSLWAGGIWFALRGNSGYHA